MSGLRGRIVWLTTLLVGANVATWAWALAAFRADPLLLGTALLAWGLGLRHAVDADHIAAIDNVTRKLRGAGGRPVTTGFWFAIGHSGVVLIATAIVAASAAALRGMETVRAIGGTIGTLISAAFLFAVAAINLVILASVWRGTRHVRAGGAHQDEDLDLLLSGRGLLARLFRPMFRLVTRPWHMAPLGALLGLGFDTASEVAILGVSATTSGHGLHTGSVLVFPALFACGMALVDTADGILMLGAYGWAFVEPGRKLAYNLAITLLSAVVAIGIGGVEVLDLLGDRLRLYHGIWALAHRAADSLGAAAIGLFLLGWLASALLQRQRRPDRLAVLDP